MKSSWRAENVGMEAYTSLTCVAFVPFVMADVLLLFSPDTKEIRSTTLHYGI